MSDSGVCAIVLAAGHGSRFRALAGDDQNKLLAPCVGRDGLELPVLEHTLRNLQGVVSKILLITRPDNAAIIALAQQYRCELVLLASAGMGNSIAAAVSAAPVHSAWLMVLADMPFILPRSLRALVAALQDDGITVLMHEGERGHPVGFGREFGPALMTLQGDQGAKRLFKDAKVQVIEVTDPGVLWDVDVPERLVFL